MGSPILTGALSYDKGTLGFYLPEIEDTYYTMNLSQTVEALTGQEVDLSVLALPEISGKEWRSLLESYLDIVYTVVNEKNVTVENGVSFSLPQLGSYMDGHPLHLPAPGGGCGGHAAQTGPNPAGG